MKITRQATADKLSEYLHGELTQAELVEWSPREAVRHGPMPHGERGVRASHWAERAMIDAEFDEADIEVLSDIIGRLGLADVAEFGLRWRAVAGATFTGGGAGRGANASREWSRWETSDMDGQTREGEHFGRRVRQSGQPRFEGRNLGQ